jgi:hypothetical protein
MAEEFLNRKRVCVDLDGTLLGFDGWKGYDSFGDPIPGAVQFTKDLSEFAEVIIYTCRCSSEIMGRDTGELRRNVQDFLDKHGFAYSEIYCGNGKPFAHAYIDDRAVVCDPMSWVGPEVSYRAAIMSARALCRIPDATRQPAPGN